MVQAVNELCSILFPKVMEEVLKQSRPKTYEELENAVDDLTSKYNKVLEQLTKAVKDVESERITADDLIYAFTRIPKHLALTTYSNMCSLLGQSPTWQKYSPTIHLEIISRPDWIPEMHVEGDYVVEKKVEHEVSYVEAGATGINVGKTGKGRK